MVTAVTAVADRLNASGITPGAEDRQARSAAQTASHTAAGSCSAHPGAGKDVGYPARPSASSLPSSPNSPARALSVPTSRPSTAGPLTGR